MKFRCRKPVLAFVASLALAPWAARALESKAAAPPPPPALAFRGWALTDDYELAKVYGNASQYTVKFYADVSSLPWNTNVTGDGWGGLASDPWDWRYLYLAVPGFQAQDPIYRFDLTTNTTSLVVNMPYVQMGYTLQGLGARCSSKLANLYGGVPFYSHRHFHPATSYNVREVTTTGAEVNVYTSPDYSYRAGDNSQQLFGGPHWFTWDASDANGNPSWGVTQLSPAAIVMGTNDGRNPTGMLSYGSGVYYVSTNDNRMYLVNTNFGTSGTLSYVVSAGSYPSAPNLIDLSNPANFCTVVAQEVAGEPQSGR